MLQQLAATIRRTCCQISLSARTPTTGRRWLHALVAVVVMAGMGVAARGQVVISQVYTGGGLTGASWNNDYIELYNRGTASISVNGWSVQYASATGSTWAVINLSNTTIPPGGYYLIQAGRDNTVTAATLPTPEVSSTTFNMAGASGKLALVSTTTALTSATPTDASIIDLVGYGSAGANRTSSLGGANVSANNALTPTPLNNTTAIFRGGQGSIDYQNNATDFTVGVARPRNSAAALTRVARTPHTTRVDANATGATANGTLANDEYGTSNSNVFFGAGNGFSGELGNSRLYFKSDSTNLSVAFQPGATLNNATIIYIDSRAGGFDDSSMFDNNDAVRRAVTDPGAGGTVNFPSGFGADYAIYIDSGSVVWFELNGGTLNFLGNSTLVTGNNTNLREVSIPLATLGMTSGQEFSFFTLCTSSTRFLSNETIPPSFAFNSAGSPGNTAGGTITNFARFITNNATFGVIATDCNTTPIPVATTGTNSVNGSIDTNEYTSNIPGGSNAGFGGILGTAANLRMISDGARLKVALSPSGTGFTDGNNVVVAYIDSRLGGFNSTGGIFSDVTTKQLRAATRPGAGGVTFPANFLADYAIVFSDSGTFVYELLASATPTVVASSSSAPNGGLFANATGNNANARELEIPLNLIGGPNAGSHIGYFALLTNGTNGFLSNEAIPANILPGSNPGSGAATVTNFSRFRLAGSNLAPAILTQPTGVGGCVGTTQTTGSVVMQPYNGNVTFQWQKSSVNISGATNPALTIVNGQTTDTSSGYTVNITRSCGTNPLASSPTTITFNPQPTITTQPSNQAVCTGQTATFAVVATASIFPSYQWQLSTDGGANWANISGATAASFATSAGANGNQYRCAVTNSSACTIFSNAATLTITGTTPTISTQPTNQSAGLGGSFTLSVTATGSGLSYQWRRGTSLTNVGTNSNTYTVTNASGADFDQYQVVVTSGGSCSITSNTVFVSQAGNDTCGTNQATFTIPGSGGSQTGTLVGATADFGANGSCTGSSGGVDVYYYFTPAFSGSWIIQTCRTGIAASYPNLDSVLSVHTGCVATAANQVSGACSDEGCSSFGGGNNSRLTATLTAGTPYVIRVALYNSSPTTPAGPFILQVTAPPPTNDTCTTATSVTITSGSGSAVASNLQAAVGIESGPPAPSCGTSVSRDVWFQFTTPSSPSGTNTWQLSTCGSDFDTMLEVFSGSSCTALTLVPSGCNDDISGASPCAAPRSAVAVSLAANTTYRVRVAASNGSTGGSIALNVSVPTPPSGTGTVVTTPVTQGCQTLLTVTPTPGANPTSTGYTVTGNLTAIGGSATQQFFDDGSNGDATPGDNIFSFRATVAGATTTGAKTLSFTVSDAQLRTSAAINFPTLNVNAYYGVSPTSVTAFAGTSVTFSTTVSATSTGGAGNVCTSPSGQAVTINLSTIGGGSSVAMTEGPAGTWTTSYTIPGGQAEAVYPLPVTITDAQSRTASANLSLTVGYCTSAAINTTNEKISRVQVGTLNNPSTATAGYENFTSVAAPTLQIGVSYPITVTLVNPFASDRCTVYVDWNRNGVLNDSGESFQLNSGGGPVTSAFTGTIVPPSGATLGNTRMRVSMGDSTGTIAFSNTNPCLATFTWGQVEDYTVSVAAAPSFTMSASASPTSVPQGCSTTLTATLSGTFSAPVTVTANLTNIGGAASVPMTETGPNTGIFTLNATVGNAVALASQSIAISAIDNSSNTSSASTSVTVTSGTITATPGSAVVTNAGVTICLQTTLTTPACRPIAGGTTVTVNLTNIGGSSTFALSDDGSTPGCDATSADGIYGASYTIPSSGVQGVFSLPVTITEPGVGGRTATATLSVTVRPANDVCANAITLADGTFNNLSNAGATTGTPAPNCPSVGSSNDVWFNYTACASGTLRIDTCGTQSLSGGIDSVLSVFTGTCAASTLVACNDDHGTSGTNGVAITGCSTVSSGDSGVSFAVTAGTLYRIRVATYQTGAGGNFNLRISGPSVSVPTAPAASPTSVCLGSSSSISAVVGSGGDVVQWFTDSCGGTLVGTGSSLSVSPTSTTTYFARSLNSLSGCTSSTCASITVTVIAPPTADASSAQTICATGSATLNGAATNAASTLWSTPGDGSFDDANILNAIYTPGTNDLAAGTVTLTLTANGNAPCAAVQSQVIITLQPTPSVNAGSASSICSGDTVAVSGTSFATSSTLWSTSGDGVFADASALATTYTPGTSDLSGGSFTLTLTGQAISPCSGSVLSNRTITVNPPTSITTGPTSQSECVGNSVTFSVAAAGASLTYQWRKDGFPISGAIASSYTVSSIASADAGSYDCVVTGACGNATSSAATLTVKPTTTITTQPPSTASQCSGSSTSFSVVAAGSALTYAWQQSTNNGGSWSPAVGIKSAATYITSTSATDATLYRCVVSGECGPAVTSSIVTLTVNDGPSITTQPSSTFSACVGQTPTLSVAVSGTSPFTYVWEYSINSGGTWLPAPGASDANSYTLQAVVATDAGNLYRVTISNLCGSVTSTSATLSLGGTVNLALTVQLADVSSGAFQRCVIATLYDGNCPGGVDYPVTLNFTNGVGTGTITSVTCSTYTGIAIRDPMHTLRRTALAGSSAFNTADPSNLVATFNTSTGKALLGGNVNDDPFVDILDFGGFVGQLGQTIGAASGCSGALHPDFNGDGQVFTADFVVIQSNFLASREADPCGSPIIIPPNQPGGPMTDIAVVDLVHSGLWSYARADLNKDWRLNTDDIAFAAFNGVPRCVADYNGRSGVTTQDIFDYLNGWMDQHPGTDANRSGSLDAQDIFDFLNAWFAGC